MLNKADCLTQKFPKCFLNHFIDVGEESSSAVSVEAESYFFMKSQGIVDK